MINGLEWIVDAPIPCPECGKEAAAKIGFLQSNDAIPCPYCGTVIDLTTPERRAFINEFSKAVASVFPRFEDISKKD